MCKDCLGFREKIVRLDVGIDTSPGHFLSGGGPPGISTEVVPGHGFTIYRYDSVPTSDLGCRRGPLPRTGSFLKGDSEKTVKSRLSLPVGTLRRLSVGPSKIPRDKWSHFRGERVTGVWEEVEFPGKVSLISTRSFRSNSLNYYTHRS